MAKTTPKRSYAPRHLSLREKHAFYVDKSGGPDACWPWTAGIATTGGYGIATNPGQGHIMAHRLSYIVNVGPIPNGRYVLHECDNPPCQNPKHLFLGTYLDNSRDMYSKGRGACTKGVNNGRAILTEEAVRKIKIATGAQWRIAEQYGVCQATVSAIKRGAAWPHIQ